MKLINTNHNKIIKMIVDQMRKACEGFIFESKIQNIIINSFPWINKHVTLADIPNGKSLSHALFEYLENNSNERMDRSVQLECPNCGGYSMITEIPAALTDLGTLDCPHCKMPWLTYSYKEK